MPIRHIASLAAALTIVAASSRAYAQTDAQRDEARRHFTHATELVRESRWRDAIVELEATRAIVVSPAVLYNLGIAHRAVGENRAAIAAFQQLLALDASTVDPMMHGEAQDFVRELTAALAHIRVRVEPAEAAVTVDGEPLGATETVDVDPGRHVVSASANGYRVATQILQLRAAETAEASLHLALVRTAARIHVESDVGLATITLDGRDIGTGTADADVDPGRHVIQARANGRQPFRDEITVNAGTTTRIRARLVAPRSILASPWLWAGAGLLVGGAVVAGVLLSGGTEEGVRPAWGVVTTAIVVDR